MNEESSPHSAPARKGMPILGWVLLGAVLGGALVAAFIAYGQPGLLLEQTNVRYCG